MADTRASAYSHRIKVADVPNSGLDVTIDVGAEDRGRIAGALGLERLDRLSIVATVKPWRGDGFRLDGRIEADVVQLCVVSLEPVNSMIEEPLSATFVRPSGPRRTEAVDVDFDALEEDPPEEIVGGAIDVGALAVEYLSLAVDPYPRAPSVRLEDEAPQLAGGDDGNRQRNPFEDLRKLTSEPEGSEET